MQYSRLLLLALILIFAKECFSQKLNKEKLDEYLKVMESNDKFMGNVLIYQHNKKIYSRALGFSNIDAGVKANDETEYRIGSISKTITAVLTLKAIEEGKIKYSDNIKTFFPSIEHADQITIRHLLNHHSGIHNFTGGSFEKWKTEPRTRLELVDSIVKGGSDFPPGTKPSYSNSNYVLLSFILEDLYHRSYGEILDNKLIKPLQLKHFYFGDKMITPEHKALSYSFVAGWEKARETDLSIPMGAGAIVSSADDLARVLNAIFHGEIVTRSTLAQMEEQSDGFGLGIFEKTILGKTAYTHDGAIDGFNSYYYYFSQDEMLYVLLSNGENYTLETINESILSIASGRPVDLPAYRKYSVGADDLQQYSGSYASQNSPLVIDIWVKNGFLLAQPHGQRVYTMEPTEKDKFDHEKTGVTLEFVPDKKQMLLKQREQTIIFTKE